MQHIDLFAGIGGFSLAAKNLGLKTAAFSEIDSAAIQSYLLNFPDHENLGDITKLKAIPTVDVVTAGIPCQPWSIAGAQKGFDDPRGKLWEDTIRVIKNSQPKAFICENVKGMTFKKHKEALDFIVSQLEEAGYNCYLQILNSRYFDVPQNRERLFIVGFKKSNLYAANKFQFPVGQETKKIVSDILENNVSAEFALSEKALDYMGRHFGKKTRWDSYANHWDTISHCITANFHKGVPYNVLVDHNKARQFTPRELARLQGYPDTFHLHPKKTHAYKQIGNSVTVPVVQAVMKNVSELI